MTPTAPRSFQEIILRLQTYWASKGCAILQPYDMEVGAGTFHPATTLRALGSKPWAAAYVQPSRRPTDGRYGENPNRLQHYYQYQVIIKPSPPDLQALYLGSLTAIGVDATVHDIRFVEDDWESPTLGAWGLGWEVWCDGMEVSQFTYFQQVGGHDCHPVSGELTYGLERLAMYILGVDHVMDMPFNDPDSVIPLKYGDIFRQTEQEYSRWNFDQADTGMLLKHFEDAEAECTRILAADEVDKAGRKIVMAHPAYDQCIKASHLFNLLDARGVISVTERQAYIGRGPYARQKMRRCLRDDRSGRGGSVNGDEAATDADARFLELEERFKKLKRREKRNLRHARAHGFLDGILALLRPGDIVIDCGANLGEVSAPLAATGAEVYAFEPDPYAFGQLSERLGDTANVTLRQQAVSTASGTLRLMRAANFDQNPKGGSVKSTLLSGGRGISEEDGIDVEVIDFVVFLKDLIAAKGPVTFLKMDIEGAELDLLAAMDAAGLFENIRCTVAETHENKFKDLRPRYRELRTAFSEKYAPNHVNLDWI